MIGRFNPQQREALIVGGGISGLLITYFLLKRGFRVELHEAAGRLGGLIQTQKTEYGIAEAAAHSVLVSPAVERLFKELDLELSPSQTKKKFIFRNGKCRSWPLTPLESIQMVFFALFRFASNPPSPSTSLEEWGAHHLGQASVDYLLDPFLTGIYAATPREISLLAAYPNWQVPKGRSLFSHQLLRRKSKAKSLGIHCVRGGMESLTVALEERIRNHPNARICFFSEVSQKLPHSPNLVLTVPAPQAAALLETDDSRTSELLSNLDYAPLVTVTSFYERASFSKRPEGLGVLVPSRESKNVRALGVLFNSASFPERVSNKNLDSFTTLYGGTRDREALKLSDSELTETLSRDHTLLLGAQSTALHHVISRWPKAIPVYQERLFQSWHSLERGWCQNPGKLVFGNYAGAISIRGMIEECEIQTDLL